MDEDGGRMTSVSYTHLQMKERKGNIVTGIVGALLGALLGGVLWVIIYQLGYIAGIAGLVAAVCALKGYETVSYTHLGFCIPGFQSAGYPDH